MSSVLYTAAELMAVSARTAPKTRGQDFVVIEVLDKERVEELARGMMEYAQKTGRKVFELNGENVKNSEAVLLIGLKNPEKCGLNCGACGVERCAELGEMHPVGDFAGPICAWRLVDLGIAIGSAAKMAGILNVDNRVMLSVGVVARHLGFIDADVVVGIPLAASGKNIFFDRFDRPRS